jgi:hypothetical protein
MNDYQKEAEIESNRIVRYLRGNLGQNEHIPLNIREVLERLPLYSTQDAIDDEEFEFEGLNFEAPNIGKLIEDSFWVLHDELQEKLVEEIRQYRESLYESNQRIVGIIDGRLQDDSRSLPFNPAHSLKISYLLNEYFRDRYSKSEHSERQVESEFGKQFVAKYDTYRACSRLSKYCTLDSQKREKNFRELQYRQNSKPEIFKNKKEVALFFLALHYSRYLYVFQGWPIEERLNVRQLFEDNEYYVKPCDNCRGGIHINDKYMMSEFDKNTNPDNEHYEVFSELWKQFDEYPSLESPPPLLPDCLRYKRLKTKHLNTPSP